MRKVKSELTWHQQTFARFGKSHTGLVSQNRTCLLLLSSPPNMAHISNVKQTTAFSLASSLGMPLKASVPVTGRLCDG